MTMDGFRASPELRVVLGLGRLLSDFLIEKVAQTDPCLRALGDAARDDADSVIVEGGLAGISDGDQARARKALEELRARLESTPSWQSIDERQEGRSEVVREVARGGAN